MRETEIFKISTYRNVNVIDLAACLISGIICIFSFCESVCLSGGREDSRFGDN